MAKEKRQLDLGTAPIGRLIAKFSIPTVISMVVNAVYNLVDQIFIGQGVGYLGNGATNVIFPFSTLALAVTLLLGNGAAAFFSLKLGGGDKKTAERAVNNTVVFTIILGVAMSALFLIFLQPLCQLFGCTDNILPYALDYGWIIMLGVPFVTFSVALNDVVRADGNPRYSMLSTLAGAVLNCILDPVFIFLFHWGVKGAALATILGQILTAVFAALYIPRFQNIRLRLREMVPSLRLLGTVAKFGVSSFINQMAICVSMVVINNCLTLTGAQSEFGADIPLTVFGIVNKVSGIILSAFLGIAIGAQPIVGFNYGAKQYGRVKKTYLMASGIAMGIGLFGTLIFELFPKQVTAIFGQEDELYVRFAVICFRVVMSTLVLNALTSSTGVFFQAMGKPVRSAVISLMRQVVLLIPIVVLASVLFGIMGLVWGVMAADTLSCVIAVILVLPQLRKLDRGEAL